MRRRRDLPLHYCEMHGGHPDTPATGYIEATTYLGHQVHVWGCDECRTDWLTRHDDAEWHPWPDPERSDEEQETTF